MFKDLSHWQRNHEVHHFRGMRRSNGLRHRSGVKSLGLSDVSPGMRHIKMYQVQVDGRFFKMMQCIYVSFMCILGFGFSPKSRFGSSLRCQAPKSSMSRTPTTSPICFHRGHTCILFEKDECLKQSAVSCRNWTIDKLNAYCMKHYGVKPDPVLNRLQQRVLKSEDCHV